MFSHGFLMVSNVNGCKIDVSIWFKSYLCLHACVLTSADPACCCAYMLYMHIHIRRPITIQVQMIRRPHLQRFPMVLSVHVNSADPTCKIHEHMQSSATNPPTQLAELSNAHAERTFNVQPQSADFRRLSLVRSTERPNLHKL